jgi:hypothetical protein
VEGNGGAFGKRPEPEGVVAPCVGGIQFHLKS